MRLQSPGSNPVSLIFTVGFHTTASVWILQNRYWYSAKALRISTHYIRQYRGLCCTSLWYSHYTRRQPWPDLESAATRQ